jgi:hypothetical protein
MESKVFFSVVLLKFWQIFPLKLKENSPIYSIFVPKTKNSQFFLVKKQKKLLGKKPFYRFFLIFFSVCNFVMIQKWKKNPEETHISKVFTKNNSQDIVKIHNKSNHCYGCIHYTPTRNSHLKAEM